MPTLEDLFVLHTARSGGYDACQPGDVAFVTNGLRDNGVLGFITPEPDDRVFGFVGIVLSAFLEATVHLPPFVARGNGGSGLIVLEPRTALSPAQLGVVAAYINSTLSWRFSWYRQTSVSRVKNLQVPVPVVESGRFRVATLLPEQSVGNGSTAACRGFRPVRLDEIYDLVPGDFHSVSDLPPGDIPIVSCGDADNGITGFVDVSADFIYSHRLTISFNGMNTLAAKYHPYPFATKDDVAVCTPLAPLRVSTEVFIQVMLGRERWRYSYYRKCFMEKLKRFSIPLPFRDGRIDEDAIATLMGTTPYWGYIEQRLAQRT